jgi:hypothetical protein
MTPVIQPPAVMTDAQLAAVERDVLNAVQITVNQRLQPLAAHAQAASLNVTRDALMRDVQRLIQQSEERQRQALRDGIVAVTQDVQRAQRAQTSNVQRVNSLWRDVSDLRMMVTQQSGR